MRRAKASQDSDISTKLIKQSIDTFNHTLHSAFDSFMGNSILSSILENGDVIPVFKKDKRIDKNNYQPIGILLEEFRNMKSSFLTEVKSFKNEFLQSCFEHSPGEQVRENSMNKISERFLKHLEEQISFLREQLRNKGKIINSLIKQLSKKSEVKQTPFINPQDKK